MELIILNENFENVDVLDSYESLIWTDRYSGYGDFEIYTPATPDLMNKIKQDYYLWSDSSDHLMIMESIKIESNVELGNHVTITGRSLESLLTRRICWDKVDLDGYLQGQIQKMLDRNIISPSISYRKIPNFIFENSSDENITKLRVSEQFTGDVIYEAIKSICDSYNIGFQITLNANNQFVFKLYSGVDRSYDQDLNPYVVFSPNFENIINSNYLNSKIAYKNVTLVAGEGEGSARRTLVVGSSSSSGLHRRELYTDARDISATIYEGETERTLTTAQYNEKLRQRGTEKLAENGTTVTFDGQVEATQMYRFGEHFGMGDIVQLENEYGIVSKARVVEYIQSESSSGSEAYPTFSVIGEE